MNPNLFREDMTKILIPKGELLSDFLAMLAKADLEAREVSPGSLAFTIGKLVLPLILVAARARDIGVTIDDPQSQYSVGFTGTDIIAEQGLNNSLGVIDPRLLSKRSQVVFGSTPNWNEKVAKPRISELPSGSQVITPYPNLTTSFLEEKGVSAQVVERLGSIESFWWGCPNNTAIVDVRVSGKTMEANRIRPMEVVLDNVSIGIVTPRDDAPFTAEKAQQTWKDLIVAQEFIDIFQKRISKQRRRT